MTFTSRPSDPASDLPPTTALEVFRPFLRDRAVANPHGPALPGAHPGPFTPTAYEVLHGGEMEQMAWSALLLHFGDMVEMRTLSQGGEMPFRQPGVAYDVQDGRHKGRVVGFWEEGADRPVFQLRTSSLEKPVTRRIIRTVQLLGGDFNPRPLHVPGFPSPRSAGWARDERLYRPERSAVFRKDAEGLYRVYTRLLTAAELAVVLESAAPTVRKYQALRRFHIERAIEQHRERVERMARPRRP
ncbi:hypothetical protein [Streptomyces sp. NPDC058751]|uniref:hypothetical protein n=1 Tax=Streptomyces sp. NPDC058751 TaxID=3346623 RepID=UPI0036BF44D3